MQTKQIVVLIAVPVLIFALSVGLFALLFLPGQTNAAERTVALYTLREESGKLALFKAGEETPVARYDIYLSLLPEVDAAALRQGIPVYTREELYQYLEDYGA